MTAAPPQAPGSPPDAAPAAPAPPDRAARRALWFELGAVLALAAVPDLANAILWFVEPAAGGQDFVADSVGLIARSIGVAVPLLYIMWRSGDGLAHFGLTRIRPLHLLAGIGLFAFAYVLHYFTWTLIWLIPGSAESAVHWSSVMQGYFSPPKTIDEFTLLAALSAANGFAEELVICGYMMARLPVLLGGTGRAVGVTALVFASYHIYQGPVAALLILLVTCVWLAVYAGARVLWPFAIGHALQDFLAYLQIG